MSNYPTTIPERFTASKHSPDLRDAYKTGWNQGHGIACHNVPKIGDHIDRTVDYVGHGNTVTEDNAKEYHELLCYASEQSARDFSPWENIAHLFNSAGEDPAEDAPSTEELWEAYDQGVADSIAADLEGYGLNDYMND